MENKPQDNISLVESTAVVKGKVVYINRCGRCHNLKPMQKYTAEEWSPILQVMIHKARLNASDSTSVTAYIRAHAKSK